MSFSRYQRFKQRMVQPKKRCVRTKKPRRSVTISNIVDVIVITSHRDMDPETVKSMWWTKVDYAMFFYDAFYGK